MAPTLLLYLPLGVVPTQLTAILVPWYMTEHLPQAGRNSATSLLSCLELH